MVNVGLSWSSMVGIALAIAGAALYFLRSVRPGLARDHDIFFAAVSLLCGGILFFQGWRQDPILQFGQFLLTGSAIFFAVESIRLRGVATEQAKRSTPIVDDERPVSSVYRAELDELNPYDEEEERISPRRRIRGSRDSYATREDDYEDEAPRRRPLRSSRDERLGAGDRARRRTPRPSAELDDSADFAADIDDRPVSRPRRSSTNGSGGSRPGRDPAAPKPRSNRPPRSGANRGSGMNAEPSDYVDYQPINFGDDELDNSANFD